MEVTKNKRKNRLIWATASVVFVTILGVFCLLSTFAHAAFNPQINYQGKLTTHSNVVADDGDYVMEFKLYASSTGGAALWTETRTGVNKVTLTNGLFSVMLGEVTALPTATSFFNQALFLEVSIGTTTPAVLSPRKKLGAVPAALYANDAGTVGGVGSTSLLRSDLDNAQATITNLTSTNFFAQNASITRATSTNFFASVLNAFSAFFTNLTATIATITNLTATNSTTTNATTTNLFATTINAVTGIFTNLVGTNVTSTNLVGIGTTTLATTSISRLAVGTSSMTAMVNVQGGAGVPALLVTSSTGASLLAVDDNGNVGIGTNAPAFKLDIYGDTNLSLGSYYKYNGVNLAYASTTLSNFFFGNAGNLSMIGTDNLGIGSSTLTLVSSGSSNLAFGNSALAAVTTGYSNLAFGTSSLAGLTVGYNNIAIGNRAGSNLVNGYNNIIIGNGILTAATTTANSLNIGNLITGDLSQGNVGIGSASLPNSTTTIYNDFVVGNGALTYSSSSGVTSVDNMEIGAISFPTDSGIVTWTDMPLTASTTSGVPVSYTANLAGNPILSVAGISNGAGDLSSFGVSVGTTTVLATLAVQATTSLPALSVVSSSGSSMLHIATSGNIGIGTSTPNANLNIFGTTNTLLRVATSTNQNIFVIDANGNVAISNGLNIGGYLMDSTNSIGTAGQVLISTGTSTKWVATSTFGFLVSETDPIWLAASTSYFKLSANNTVTGSNTFSGTTTLATTTASIFSIGTTSASSMLNIQGIAGVSALNITSSTGNSILTVASNANIGLGTSTPQARLSVVGVSSSPLFYVQDSDSASTNWQLYRDNFVLDNGSTNISVVSAKSSMRLTAVDTDLTLSGIAIKDGLLITSSNDQGLLALSTGNPNAIGILINSSDLATSSAIIFDTQTGDTAFSGTGNYIFGPSGESKVGIGITPSAYLDVYGTSSSQDLLKVTKSDGVPVFVVNGTGGVTIGNFNGLLFGVNGGVSALSTSSLGLEVSSFASPNISQWTNNSGYLTSTTLAVAETDSIWSAASSSYFNLSSNNTVTGDNIFNGNTTLATTTAVRLSVGTTSIDSILNIQATAGSSPLEVVSSSGAVMFTILSNGNVGIGVESPAAKLDVNGNINLPILSYIGKGTENAIRFHDSATGRLDIRTASVARISVAYSGEVGIGTTTPNANLQVFGTTNTIFRVATSTNQNIFIVNGNGNVSIGTSTATHLITLRGGAYSDGPTWENSSDRNLKENFAAVDPIEVLNKINQLSITQWNYKSQGSSTSHIGPIAQDFYSLFSLGGSDTSISTIDPAGIALVGIQALSQRLAVLESGTSSTSTLAAIVVQSSSNNSNNLNTLTVAAAATFYGTMTVFGEAGFESKVTFKNDVEIQGKLYLDQDQLGTVMIPAGTTTIEVAFAKPYNSVPKVLLNLNLSTSSIFARYAVTKKTTSSFFVIIDAPVADDLYFDWVALGLREGIVNYTASSTDNTFENLISLPIDGSAGNSSVDAVVTGTSSAPVSEAGATSTPANTSTTPETPAPEVSTAPVVTPEAPVTTTETPAAPVATPETPAAPAETPATPTPESSPITP